MKTVQKNKGPLKMSTKKGGFGIVTFISDTQVKKRFMDWKKNCEVSFDAVREIAIYNQSRKYAKKFLINYINTDLNNREIYLEAGKITLKKYMKQNTIYTENDLSVYKSFIYKIIQSAFFLKTQGIIHSDIKPSNIILDANDTPKLIDFGISQIDRTYGQILNKEIPCQTITYRSPEVVSKVKQYDYKIDIFSLALIFIELITKEKVLNFDDKQEDLLCDYFLSFLGIKSYYKDKGKKIKNKFTALKKACLDTEINWYDYVHKSLNIPIKDPQLKDLLVRMLIPSIKQRITYEEILTHPFFDTEDLPEFKLRYFNRFPILDIENIKENTEINIESIPNIFLGLIEVAKILEIGLPAIFLSFELVMLYLSKGTTISQKNIHKLGITCLIIATKLLELYLPPIDDYIYYTKNITEKDIVTIERKILVKLSGNLFYVTPFDYYQQYYSKSLIKEDLYALLFVYSHHVKVYGENMNDIVSHILKTDYLIPGYIKRYVNWFIDSLKE